MRKAVFVGSFDPWHEGHASVLRRARNMFDDVVVGIGVNPNKAYMFTTEERIERIKSEFLDVTVEAYEGLTIDFAKRYEADYIVKGVRNARDFEYEAEQAKWNKEHGGIETIMLFAEPGLEEMSSTSIRENIREEK